MPKVTSKTMPNYGRFSSRLEVFDLNYACRVLLFLVITYNSHCLLVLDLSTYYIIDHSIAAKEFVMKHVEGSLLSQVQLIRIRG